MDRKQPHEIVGMFNSFKNAFIKPTENIPFNSGVLYEIKELLEQLNDWGRSGMEEAKEALGYSSYQSMGHFLYLKREGFVIASIRQKLNLKNH